MLISRIEKLAFADEENYVSNINMHWVRLVASIALFAIYCQLFFWLRLFSSLAEYVDLIISTIRDIQNFMIVLAIFMVMFFSGFYMIQLNRTEEPYIFVEAKESFLESVLRMYYMVLGDFGNVTLIRSFEDSDNNYNTALISFENTLSVFFFVGATLITQITILNMLIAIMGVTHSSHEDMKEENSKKQRLLLETEFAFANSTYRRMSESGYGPIASLCNCF